LDESENEEQTMKKILSIVTAVALMAGSTTAAFANGRHGPVRSGYGYSQPYYGGGYGYRDYRGHDNTAAAVGFGLLAFGLIATLAAQNNNRYYGPSYGYAQPYPSQPYGYSGGYSYGGGYGYGGYGY
jgi:hypothetical protein